jgi:hypothetical protein
MIGPALLARHLHAFNDERRRCFSTLRWGRTPGFLIGQIQAKFREAAEQKHSRPENHEQTGLTISFGSNCPLVRRRLASAAGTNRLGENQEQQSRGQKEWSRAKELHENTSTKSIDRANPRRQIYCHFDSQNVRFNESWQLTPPESDAASSL